MDEEIGVVSDDGDNEPTKSSIISQSGSNDESSSGTSSEQRPSRNSRNYKAIDSLQIPKNLKKLKCLQKRGRSGEECPVHSKEQHSCAPGKCVCCTCNRGSKEQDEDDNQDQDQDQDMDYDDYDDFETRTETEMDSMFLGSSTSLMSASMASERSGESRISTVRPTSRDYGDAMGRHKRMAQMEWLSYLQELDKETDEIQEGEMSEGSRYEGHPAEEYMKLLIQPFDMIVLSSSSSSFGSYEEEGLQRTIVIVKPDAVKFKETILRVIFEAGFQILGSRVLHLSPEQVSEVYAKYYGSPSFAQLIVSVSEAPVMVMCISALNVIKKWLRIIGPSGSLHKEWFFPLSMRRLFGLHETHADWIHGSDNLTASNRENRYFFPDNILEPLLQEEDKVRDYCNLYLNPTILEACTELVKKRPADPIIYFADYLLSHNRFQPRFPQKITFTPT